jgi:plastocyanin
MSRKFELPKTIRLSLLALLLSALCSASPVGAAQFTVVMTDNFHFNPSYQEVEVDDIVTWVNRDQFDSHSSVSTDGYWDSGDLDYGDTFSIQFLAPGTYAYEDYYYWVLGMTGTIVVKPPTVLQPAALIDPTRLQDGRFQLTLSNLTAGATYIVQGSTNLIDWTSLATNIATSPVEAWADDGAAAFKRRFYRSWHLP